MTQMQLGPAISSGSQVYYDSASNFDFPNNPRVIPVQNASEKSIVDVPYRSLSNVLDFGTVSPITIVLQGTLYGSSRYTNLRSLSKQVYSSGLKKFHLDGTKFIYVNGGNIKYSLSGQRSTFIDYIVTLNSPIPFWYTTDGSISTVATSTVDATEKSASNGLNNTSGTAPNHLVKWDITTTGTITEVIIAQNGTTIANSTNVLTWTGSVNNDTLEIWTFYDANNQMILYWPCLDGSRTTKSGSISLSATTIDGPQIPAGATNEVFRLKVTGANATVTAYFWDQSDWVF